jgi:hypothetical protein
VPVAIEGTPTTITAVGADSYVEEAGTNRLVVALVVYEGGTGSRPVESGTWGGVAGTAVVSGTTAQTTATTRTGVGILYWDEADIADAGRTTDVIDITFTGGDPSNGNSRCFMLTLSGVDQTTPVDATDDNAANDSTGIALALTTASGGLVLAVAAHESPTISITWSTSGSGGTEILDSNLTNYRGACLQYDPAVGGTSYSETVAGASGTPDLSAGAASFKAAAGSTPTAALAAAYYYNR